MNKPLTDLKLTFHQSRNLVFVVFLFCMAAVFSFLATGSPRHSQAADSSKFRAGNIISDAVMGNYKTMTVTDIQNFLDSKNKCDNRDYSQYLELSKRYPNIQWHWEGEPYNGHFVCMAQEKFGDTASEIGTGMTAAEIIHTAAEENHINPQVLLVLLQKESSLITDKVPNSLDYSKATGYGCPDTAACDKKYSGFKNQIYRAAELFRYTLDNGSLSFPEGRNVYIGYHPSSSCGGSQVFIENRATAALYRYTPYQPNVAALSAGYGSGDACSAYGNRNFYLYFTDWFGSTQAAVNGELATIEDGTYLIVSSLAKDRSLGVSSANAELSALSDIESQYWKIERDITANAYTIKNISTGGYLTAVSSEVDMGTNVEVSASSTTCATLWKIYRTPDGYLTFESSCSGGIVLDVYQGDTWAGNNVQLWITNGGKSQKWFLRSGPTLAEGFYSISSAVKNTQVLDINHGNTNNGATITTWSSNASENQAWYASYDFIADTYTFTNPYSGKTLSAIDNRAGNGTPIGLWSNDNSCGQKWKLATVDGQNYNLTSACSGQYVLDLNGVAKNGAKITLWKQNGGDNQKWQFIPSKPVIEDGTYTIVSRFSDKLALDAAKVALEDGANVAIWQAHGGINQIWQVAYNSTTGDYRITNPNSNKAIDVKDSSTASGANVQVWGEKTDCSQRWQIYPAENGYYYILSACNPRRALDLYGGYISNGTNIQIWDKTGSLAQHWKFIKRAVE